MIARLTVTVLAATVSACASAPSNNPPPDAAPSVYETNLDNGLTVLVKPDSRAPVVVSQIWYKVGGSYEPRGLTGISHVLEHMMFKGTQTLGPNEFSRIIAANGGRENAFTGRDYTAYFQRLEKSRLEIAFQLEADRMQNLKMDPEEFAKEVEVVKEERRLRTEDKPEALTYEKFMHAAYTRSNYRNPIIGWPEDLSNLTIEDLEDWYQRFYTPNNATLVVAGDVDPEEVFALARRHFGVIPPRQVRPTDNPVEPRQQAPRRITVKARAQVPYVLLGFHVPVITLGNESDWEPYALEILAYILDGGKSARLSRSLVREQQVASSAGVGYDPTSRNSTLFMVDANPAQGKTVGEVEAAIMVQIEQLQTMLVAQGELDRIKAQIVASKVFEQDSAFAQAMQLGALETIGLPWALADEITERLRSVTPEQVRAVARKYLVPENVTVAVMQPETPGNQKKG
jgi:zinc protease